MPVYTFKNEDGGPVELFLTVAEYGRKVKDGVLVKDGKRLTRDLMADVPGGQTTGWPIYSDALGVHPKQIKDQSQRMAALGVPTEFKADGRMVLRDRAHRKQVLRSLGYRDNDAGYGD